MITDYLPIDVIVKSILEVSAAKKKVDELAEKRGKLIEQVGEARGEGDVSGAKKYEAEAQQIADEREQLIADAKAQIDERRQEAVNALNAHYIPSVEDAAKVDIQGIERLCNSSLIRNINELESIAESHPNMTAWRVLERYAKRMQNELPGENWSFNAGLREDSCRKFTEQYFNGLSAELERPAGLQWYTLSTEPGRIAAAYGLTDVYSVWDK